MSGDVLGLMGLLAVAFILGAAFMFVLLGRVKANDDG